MLGFEKLVLSKVPPFGWIWNVQSSFFVFLETMFLSDNIVKRASLHACLCALPPHLLTLRRISSAAANTIRSWKHAHRNCRATDATIHQPPKHVYTVYTDEQSVARKFYLWKCTLMQHVHWAKSHRVARQSSTTEHAYTQGPFNAAIPLCKVTKRWQKKTKHESANFNLSHLDAAVQLSEKEPWLAKH